MTDKNLPTENQNEEKNLFEENHFLDHLVELRNRLIKIVIGIVIIFLGVFPFANDLYHQLALPLLDVLPKGGQMIATEVTTPFFIPMKVALTVAFLISLPLIFYQIWAFIAPALYEHEKKWVFPLISTSTILFGCGMSFAYFVVFPIIFKFITSTAPDGVAVMTDISKYLDFVISTFVAFGVVFEVPILVILLIKSGIVSYEQVKDARPYVVVGAFVIGAIFTPPDILSQFLMAIPLLLLFELGLFISKWIKSSEKNQ